MKYPIQFKLSYLAVAISFYTASTYGSGIPTVDVANITQTTITAFETAEQTVKLAEQIENQVQQIKKQVENIKQLDKQFQAMTGNYDMGKLINDVYYKNLRRHIPSNWQETLKILQNGGLPGYQAGARNYGLAARDEGQYYKYNDIYISENDHNKKSFKREVDRTYVNMGVGQHTYNKTAENTEAIEQLGEQIDKASDLKAAIDLQNRTVVEVAHLLNEVVRIQSASHIQGAQSMENNINRKALNIKLSDPRMPSLKDAGKP